MTTAQISAAIGGAMAVRHVVMWKLSGETKGERTQKADELSAALNALPNVIPGVLSLSAGSNAFGPDANWDMVLVSEFPDEETLDAYASHPAHLAVVDRIKAAATERACVDIQF